MCGSMRTMHHTGRKRGERNTHTHTHTHTYQIYDILFRGSPYDLIHFFIFFLLWLGDRLLRVSHALGEKDAV
jgi:hypothetical protein